MIKWFIKRYDVDMSEALVQDIAEFNNFNDFFTRELRPDARPLDSEPNSILCPADGAVSQLGEIKGTAILQAKGHTFTLQALLGQNDQLADSFNDGQFITVYLSPRDYHRVHMPLTGKLVASKYIPGRLFSVKQATTERVDSLFARNERLVCQFDTDIGTVVVVLVGAMIVAGIETVFGGRMGISPRARTIQSHSYQDHVPSIMLEKGAELGRFYLGSTAIVLFPHGAVQFSSNLRANSQVRMGQKIALISS